MCTITTSALQAIYGKNVQHEQLATDLPVMRKQLVECLLNGFDLCLFLLGPRCEVCSPGHHGDPKNGGTCQGTFLYTTRKLEFIHPA